MAQNQNVNTLSIVPLTNFTADGQSTPVDISAYEGVAKFFMFYRDNAGTTPTLDVKAQSGSASNGSDAADISGAAYSQVAGADGSAELEIDLDKSAKYLRFDVNVGGTPDYDIAIVMVAKKKYI